MFDIQRFTTPPFGLMSAADKAAIDNFPSTYLKINDASNTYVTKSSAICGVVESDSGVAFLNGVGAVVFTLPVFKKKSPQLSISPAVSESSGASYQAQATISHLGDGALSIIEGNTESYAVGIYDNEITFALYGPRNPKEEFPSQLQYTIAVAETDEYNSATAVWTVTLTT